ncbi:arabinofuranosyltransferase [Trujillonella endophytica]|uniref:Galactan 5-O-arabinofuranosyltransferase n=1 Tax=Trujillonella endophytica TaxID=673521 RepID=A0A1H8RX95_9ACTN|nr:arabinofuranosyltransferase [Trujillella endophytica]SEO70824.1 galactan 5-O-arabinofuranosyltransferase [Trujillella endophytica]
MDQVPGRDPRPAGTSEGARHGRRLLLLPWLGAPVAVLAAWLVLPPGSDLRSQYQISVLVLAAAPLLAWLLTRGSALAHHSAGALVAALLPAMTLISLQGTDWYFSAVQGDQAFRYEYATRFADDLSLSDYTYADVPAFYSPGFFWVVGLVSKVTGIEAWRTYTWVAVATLYLAGVVAYFLWRRTCGTRLSAALLAVTVIGLPSADQAWMWSQTLLFSGAYEPYAWLVALSAPALLTWYASSPGRLDVRRGVLLGVAIGVAAWLYVLYALVIALAAVVVVLLQRRERAPLELALSGLTAIVLVSPWLGPFLVEWLDAGMPTSDALTFIEPDGSYGTLVTAVASPWLLVALGGAVTLMTADPEVHRRLRGVRALAATVLGLGLAQAVLGQAGQGVLFHRLLLVLGITLLAAGTFAAWILYPRLRPRLAAAGAVLRRPQRVAVAVLAVLLVVGLGGHAREWTLRETEAELRRLAQDTPYPDGSFPRTASAETREKYGDFTPTADLDAAIREAAAAAGQGEPGPVLTDNVALLATTPLHGYQQWWGLYANPLGEYPVRRAFLEGLEDLPAADLVQRLREDPDAPAVLALQRDPDEPDTVVFRSMDWDPSQGGSLHWSVRLPVALFDDPAFETATVGTWVVAALRTTD